MRDFDQTMKTFTEKDKKENTSAVKKSPSYGRTEDIEYAKTCSNK